MMRVDENMEVARMAGATGLVTLWGLTLNEWVATLTLVYLTWQIVVLTPKAYATVKLLFKKKRRR